jgi:TetR/AcrR family transcriptional repressor of bet genes
MRTSSIRDIRRSELSSAAFEAVIRYGLRGTTLDKVGDIAGVSKGVVLHHFKDKGALLEAVFRRSNSLLSRSVVELYACAENPQERFWSIIVANFFETIFNPRVCQAWVSLVSEVPHSRHCQRIAIVCNERIQSNFRHELRHFLPASEVEPTARALGQLIDGIWVRAGMLPDQITGDGAIDEMVFVVSKMLPADELSASKHHEALCKMKNVASIVLGSRSFREQVNLIQL